MFRKPFIMIMVAFLLATLVFGVLSLCFGEPLWGIFAKLTDGWLFGVLFMLAFDLTKRLATERDTITPTYIVMAVLIVLNIISFFSASYARDIKWAMAGIAGAVVFGVTAGVLPSIVNAVKAHRDSATAGGKNPIGANEAQEDWVKTRAKLLNKSDEMQEAILYRTLAFRTKEDSLFGELDIAHPLILNAEGLAMSVYAAEKDETVKPEDIANAKAYIKTLSLSDNKEEK